MNRVKIKVLVLRLVGCAFYQKAYKTRNLKIELNPYVFKIANLYTSPRPRTLLSLVSSFSQCGIWAQDHCWRASHYMPIPDNWTKKSTTSLFRSWVPNNLYTASVYNSSAKIQSHGKQDITGARHLGSC